MANRFDIGCKPTMPFCFIRSERMGQTIMAMHLLRTWKVEKTCCKAETGFCLCQRRGGKSRPTNKKKDERIQKTAKRSWKDINCLCLPSSQDIYYLVLPSLKKGQTELFAVWP